MIVAMNLNKLFCPQTRTNIVIVQNEFHFVLAHTFDFIDITLVASFKGL
jgi:hypothetical protein